MRTALKLSSRDTDPKSLMTKRMLGDERLCLLPVGFCGSALSCNALTEPLSSIKYYTISDNANGNRCRARHAQRRGKEALTAADQISGAKALDETRPSEWRVYVAEEAGVRRERA